MRKIIHKIRQLHGFEARGEYLLRACLAIAQNCLNDSQWSESVLYSAHIHVRNQRGYTGAIHHPLLQDHVSLIQTAGLWRWVEDFNEPLGLDANLNQVYRALVEDPNGEHLDTHDGIEVSASLARVFAEGVTHVYLSPLSQPDGSLQGMLTIFFGMPEAIGTRFIWSSLARELTLLLELVTPYLLGGPAGPSTIQTDEYLPVIGPSMQRRIQVAQHFAASEEILLIQGPSGAGKSRLARWCHAQSERAKRPFEVLDLMSVPPAMQMAELVGWKRGAFTGAVDDNPGVLARARGGTLFVDEIDKLSRETQAGLLRVFEERVFRPLGSKTGELQADVRFIIGTNVNLKENVQNGNFREDLFWRINVLTVELPALAERPDEFADWVRYMLQIEARNRGAEITPPAIKLLKAQSWPGNLRQLHNVIRRTLALATLDTPGRDSVTIEEHHVVQALQNENGAPEELLGPLMLRAARALAQEIRLANEGSPGQLPLEVVDSLRALVLIELSKDLDLAEVYALIGKASLPRNRNHHRAFARELETLEHLARISPEIQDVLRNHS